MNRVGWGRGGKAPRAAVSARRGGPPLLDPATSTGSGVTFGPTLSLGADPSAESELPLDSAPPRGGGQPRNGGPFGRNGGGGKSMRKWATLRTTRRTGIPSRYVSSKTHSTRSVPLKARGSSG